MPAITTIIGGIVGITAGIFGNALLARWLGAWRMYYDSLIDPKLKAMTEAEYQILNKEAQDIINQKPPI